MNLRTGILCTALAGCAPAAQDLPTGAAAPPLRITSSPLASGSVLTVVVEGAPAGSQVHLMLGTDVTSPGNCPPLLAPRCADLAGPVRVIGHAVAGRSGIVTFSIPTPRAVPGQVELQAYTTHRGAVYLSPGIVLDGLIGLGDEDGDGLTNATEVRHGTDPWNADSDGDGRNDLAEVQGGTDPLSPDIFDTGDSGVTGPEIAGFVTYGRFAYEPATDQAVSYTLPSGEVVLPTFGFMFFDQDFQTTGDAAANACVVELQSAAPLPRAPWAGAGTGYLFGADLEPAQATAISNCDNLFGPGTATLLLAEFVDYGVWGVGVTPALSVDAIGFLNTTGAPLSDFLGGTHNTNSPLMPGTAWDAYTAAWALDATNTLMQVGGAPVPVPAVDMVRLSAGTPAPAPVTLDRYAFESQSTVTWVFF